uniref:Homing endonuclease LAGLIDADG domain-containing protein n=1 Tax=Xylaria hypoxylon TaxID=37992 RepID=A0A6G6D9V0_9PEZI|nr:hypothetical protein [Xylaria hypoxylon]QIE13214.1 hypothetical protein [Xylaria hypoxylon]
MNNLFIIYETYTNGYKAEILDIISLLAILCAILVIISKNPIVSVLFLIGLFASISCYLIMLGLSFIGLSYLIVYIGAVFKYVWNNVAALVQLQLYKGLFILIKFFNLVQRIYNAPVSSIHLGNPNFHCSAVRYPGKAGIGPHAWHNGKFYSTLSSSAGLKVSPDKEDEEFYRWFVGFADGESNFIIVFQKDSNGDISGASFRFSIELHIDDLNTLKYIKSKLNIGNEIAVYGNSCKFTVVHRKGINILISIFDKYNLNTTKYLDYLDFKKAFHLYYENNSLNKRTLIDQLFKLKNGMNKNRINFNFPEDYKIVVSDYWLLGLLEGEGSFYLDRTKLQPAFMVALTKVQQPVLEEIKDYFINNLGFDKYSKFKLQNSSAIAIVENPEQNNAKPLLRLRISNTNVLMNYLIPFLENKRFVTKKGKDFQDFKIICKAIYNGAYRNEEIKLLILKLSYTMNNYRLSSNSYPKEASSLSKEELDTLLNGKSTVIHLDDGRQIDNITRKEINRRWTNCVYEIIKGSSEIILASTLNKAGEILNVDFRTVRRNLDSLSTASQEEGDNGKYFVEIKGNQVRRVAVFYPK